ncbi:hypothetical protein B566_EDAN000787 [Ephemera danica]|nr:hypothetical protein B566_EDAN000787 [Ephemera danica]
MGFVVPVLVSVLVALTMVCCVCCLCCPCCLWYKRRNRGTVYNNVPPAMTMQPAVPQHGPHAEMYQQQPPLPYPVMQMPQPQMDQGPYPPVPPHGVPMQQQYPPSPYPPAVPPHAQHPPTYNEAIGTQQPQMYSRQAPYNPNF